MKLSLMVHANRNRAERVQCLLTRLTLNKELHPDVDFEVILFDGGSNDQTKALCEHFAKYLDLKYIFCPIFGPTDETYPLSIMNRLCTGENIGFVSADHWISENLISEMIVPEGADVWLGRVARSEHSKAHKDPVSTVDALLDDRCSGKEIASILELCKIDPIEGCSLDLWCHTTRELPEGHYGGGKAESPTAVAIDMWSPDQDFIEVDEELGKLPEYGYAVIDGQTLNVEELENYIEQQS